MKYIKLLLLALFASAIFVSCRYEEEQFKGKGDAVVQFDLVDEALTRTIREGSSELVKLNVSYLGEPTEVPFSVGVDIEVISDDNAMLEDVIWLTNRDHHVLYFGKGETEDETGKEIPMHGTQWVEFKVASRPDSNTDAVVKFTLKNPTNGVTIGERDQFTVTIVNVQ